MNLSDEQLGRIYSGAHAKGCDRVLMFQFFGSIPAAALAGWFSGKVDPDTMLIGYFTWMMVLGMFARFSR